MQKVQKKAKHYHVHICAFVSIYLIKPNKVLSVLNKNICMRYITTLQSTEFLDYFELAPHYMGVADCHLRKMNAIILISGWPMHHQH